MKNIIGIRPKDIVDKKILFTLTDEIESEQKSHLKGADDYGKQDICRKYKHPSF